MKRTKFLLHVLALVACLMCALGASAAEAYACYTSSNTTLTFYYDNLRSSRSGTTYDLNEGDQITPWENDGTNANVTRVVFNSSFADARPTTTYSWFYQMKKLTSITGLNYLNTSDVTDMRCMFMSCNALTSVDVSGFNTSKVTKMTEMFFECRSLTGLDLSSFNTAQVYNMNYMFYNCSALNTIYVGDGWTTNAVTYSENMFYNCTSLAGGMGTTYDANHVDKTYAHIDGGTANPGYLTEFKEAYACYTPSNTTLTFYYDNQRSNRSGTTYDLNTGSNYPAWYSDDTNANVTKVVFDSSFAAARPTTTYAWFYHMQNLTSITGMKEYLNTSAVTNMGLMFASCRGMTSLDLSGFNTAKVTIMSCMFMWCSSMTNLNMSGFNTSNVIDMSHMFSQCNALTTLDVSGFNTAKVILMLAMFYNCNALTSLDLSGFNTAKVTNMYQMFYRCEDLTTIYAGSGWSTAAVTTSSDMFYHCTSLVGGMGTKYSYWNPLDKTYAHIDGGTANPGYFTDKNAYLRGDVNGDGDINISDVTRLIDVVLGKSVEYNADAADCNQNGSVNISDVTALINFVLSGHW